MAAVTDEAIGVVERFLRLVEDAHIDIQKAVLFGSYARGTAGKWSDIDIALVSPSFSGVSFYDNKMLIPFMLKVDSRLELHLYRPEDFTEDDPFVKEIVKTGVGLKV
ncbi:MAG: nucleotidyltransferase domain-containing protein [Deltaproteobacteria bacterium]|nr:nucleotidyltransferase domain-containing protein [Deltaproteobacteria bacterium]